MSFLNNLFGTIGQPSIPGPRPDFIPADGQGKTIEVKGDAAVWLGLQNPKMQQYAYDFCFPLASVVDRLAEMDLNGVFEVLKVGGKGKNDYLKTEYATLINGLFEQPNPLQSWYQFRGQQIVHKKIFGYAAVFPLLRSGFGPEYALTMMNIPPDCIEVIGTRKILYATKLEEIVKEYRITILGQSFILNSNQLIILPDSFMLDHRKDYLLPQSKLVGLDMAVSNLCAGMEADNVLLRKKGPLGFISHDAAATKDSNIGYIPMTEPQKKEVQEELSKYGMTWAQYQYVISRVPLKWNSMSFSPSELGTGEVVERSEKAICQRMGYPYPLYLMTDSTFANGNQAAKMVYQDNIIPSGTRDFKLYAKFFKAKENNANFTYDFSDTPVMAEDKKTAAEAERELNLALKEQWENDIITRNQYLERMGYDKIVGMDIYYSAYKNGLTNGNAGGEGEGVADGTLEAQAALKGSVGGVQGILAIQAGVVAGTTTFDSAMSMLTIIYGFSEDQANDLLGAPKEETKEIDYTTVNLD